MEAAPHEIHGTYEVLHHGVEMEAIVRDHDDGFEIEWADGMRVTVVDEATVMEYLENDSAVKISDRTVVVAPES